MSLRLYFLKGFLYNIEALSKVRLLNQINQHGETHNKMKKVGIATIRIILVLLAILVGLMTTLHTIEPMKSRMAEDTRFYVRDININGNKVVNYHLTNPFFLYLDSAYLPVTKALGQIMGFSYLYHEENHAILLAKIDPTQPQLAEQVVKNEGDNPVVEIRYDVKVYVTSEIAEEEGRVLVNGHPEGRAADFEEEGLKQLDLSGYPILQGEDGVFYLPIRALAQQPDFRWDLFTDPYYGLCISTYPDVTAESLWSEKESLYNKGLAEYIRSRNPNIRPSVSQEYVFYFLNAARESGVEVEWIIAISQCESRFRKDVVSKAGAVGMMQIMEKTGVGYGLSKEDLLNPKKNIDFGASYFAGLMDGYKGDRIRALSAYQMGIPKENLGGYEPTYANTIMWAHDNLASYLKRNGFI